ncbi:MAG: TolC family protein [Gemmatimonadetes bacterium]|nr:TolC family protein [Gemmatimonadota bacterium]
MFTIRPALQRSVPAVRLGAVMALLAIPIRAQDPLDSIARIAITRNLAVRQGREAEAQGQLAVRQARGLYLPTVGLDARYSELSGAVNIGDAVNPAYAALNQLLGRNVFPTNINQTLPFKQETRLRTTVPLFNGALHANLDAARAVATLRGAERAAAVRSLDATARLAYLDHARARRAVDVWDATLLVLRENERVASRMLAAGTITGDVVFRARAAVADGEQQLAESVRLRQASLGALNLLLDRELDTAVPELIDSLLPAQAPVTRDEALANARRREEFDQAEAGVAAARAQGRAASSAFLPSVALAADVGVQGANYAFNSKHDVAIASLVLSWNLFNGGQDARRREVAASAERAMTYRTAELQRAIALEVGTAHDAVAVAQKALAAAHARVDAARRAFQMVDRRFVEGLAAHLEWSDARTQLTSADLNLVLSRYTLAARVVDLERAAALRRLPQ